MLTAHLKTLMNWQLRRKGEFVVDSWKSSKPKLRFCGYVTKKIIIIEFDLIWRLDWIWDYDSSPLKIKSAWLTFSRLCSVFKRRRYFWKLLFPLGIYPIPFHFELITIESYDFWYFLFTLLSLGYLPNSPLNVWK